MMKSISGVRKKRGRGRPAIGATAINLRLPPTQIGFLDSWIASQPDPKPTRPEAIRRLLERALDVDRPERTVEQKIATAKDRIARNPDSGEPSPEQGMATLRRGLAETKLRSLKAHKDPRSRKQPSDDK